MDVVARIGAGSTIAGRFRVVGELGKGGRGVVLERWTRSWPEDGT